MARNQVHQTGSRNVPAPAGNQSRWDMVRMEFNSQMNSFAAATKAIGLPPEHFIQAVMLSCRRNPKLLDCSLASLVACALQTAQLGLVPDDARGQCHLIPYGGEATLQIGYKGLVQLARRGGKVIGVNAEVVFDGEFEHPGFVLDLGVERRLVHVPLPPSKRGEEIIGCYATTSHPGPQGVVREFTWMWLEDVEKIRQATRTRNKGRESPAWSSPDTYPEMVKKTVLKRHLKYADQSAKTQQAIYLDDRLEMGQPQRIAESPDKEAEAKTAQVANKMRQEVDPNTGEVVPSPEDLCPGCGALFEACTCPTPET